MTVHIVGAGLAGLSAAIYCLRAGQKTALYESAPHAGGRCRSFFDSVLERVIDNGSHLILSGNTALAEYLEIIGAQAEITTPAQDGILLLDPDANESWTVKPTSLWRPLTPGASFQDTWALVRMLWRADPKATVAQVFDSKRPVFAKLWRPLCEAALNAPPEKASAWLLRRALLETALRGPKHMRPLLARNGLSSAFVDPAITWIKAQGGKVFLQCGLMGWEQDGERINLLRFDGQDIALGPDDRVILAVPPWSVATLSPNAPTPQGYSPIVNAHFRLGKPAKLPDDRMFVGIIGRRAQWIFLRGDVLSVTVSAASDIENTPAEQIARLLWQDAAEILKIPDHPLPRFRVLKERRATFAQSPENEPFRPGPLTSFNNLFLAGDWTFSGWPAALETAVRSGKEAAQKALLT